MPPSHVSLDLAKTLSYSIQFRPMLKLNIEKDYLAQAKYSYSLIKEKLAYLFEIQYISITFLTINDFIF